MNAEEINAILRSTSSRIARQDYAYDYLGQAKSIQHDDGAFWYDYSQTLRTVPASLHMDLRENGAIATAVYAANRAHDFSPASAGTIAEKLLALEMMTHGLSAGLNLGINQTLASGRTTKEWYLEVLSDWRSITRLARATQPHDDWFKGKEQELKDSFGLG